MFADLDGAHRQRGTRSRTPDGDHHRTRRRRPRAVSGGTALVAAELQTIFQHFVDAEFAADSAERLEQSRRRRPHPLAGSHRRATPFRRIRHHLPHRRGRSRRWLAPRARPLDMVLNLICDQTTFETQLAHRRAHPHADRPGADTDWSQRRCEHHRRHRAAAGRRRASSTARPHPPSRHHHRRHPHRRRPQTTTLHRRRPTRSARPARDITATTPAAPCPAHTATSTTSTNGSATAEPPTSDNAGLQCNRRQPATSNAPDSTSTGPRRPTPHPTTRRHLDPSRRSTTTTPATLRRHPATTATTSPNASDDPDYIATRHRPRSSTDRRAATDRELTEDRSSSATLGAVTPLADIVERIMSARDRSSLVLVGIGGHGASGKSTLARRIAEEIADTQIVATDSFWNGTQFELDRLRTDVVDVLLAGNVAHYDEWDWATSSCDPAAASSRRVW